MITPTFDPYAAAIAAHAGETIPGNDFPLSADDIKFYAHEERSHG